MSDRLQKKCVAGSALLHGTLVFVLIFGAAFSRPEKNPNSVEPLQIVDISRLTKVTDGKSTGGGNPAPAQPQPQPQPQPPAPQPPPPEPKAQPVEEPKQVKLPDPPKVKVKPLPEPKVDKTPIPTVKDNDITLKEEPKEKKPKPHQIKPDLSEVVDTGAERKRIAAKKAEEQRKQEEAEDKAYRNALASARNAVRNIGHSSASAISSTGAKAEIVEINGVGGGGPAAAKYLDVVFSAYFQAWIAPEDVPSTARDVVAKVIVSRNGSIVSARITRRSGNDSLDHSVERALKAVDHLPEFPPETSDMERTFNITFDLEAKRSQG